MKRTIALFKSVATLILFSLSLTSAAFAGTIYVNDGVHVTSYLALSPFTSATLSSNPGASVTGMAFTMKDTTVSSGPVLLAAASGSGEIYAYSLSGTRTNFASVNDPIGLAVNATTGDVYTGANGGTKIEELSPTGATVLNTITTDVSEVDSLATDAAGDLFEADGYTGKINEYLLGGGVTTVATLTNAADFYGMAFDDAGDLFVSYWNGMSSGGIFEISPTGTVSSFYSATTVLPVALAYDSDSGELFMSYVTSINGNTGGLVEFNPVSGGTVSALANTVTTTLDQPYGLAALAPEPGTILLFISALLSLSIFRFRPVRQ